MGIIDQTKITDHDEEEVEAPSKRVSSKCGEI
jgi:hypothetical protein